MPVGGGPAAARKRPLALARRRKLDPPGSVPDLGRRSPAVYCSQIGSNVSCHALDSSSVVSVPAEGDLAQQCLVGPQHRVLGRRRELRRVVPVVSCFAWSAISPWTAGTGDMYSTYSVTNCAISGL